MKEEKKEEKATKLEEFKGFIPDVGKELLEKYLTETSITERMKVKAQIRSLFEFLDPETTTGDIRKLFDQLPQFRDTIQNVFSDMGMESGPNQMFSSTPRRTRAYPTPETMGGDRSIRIPDDFREEIKKVLAEEKAKETQEEKEETKEGGENDTSPYTE